MANVKFYLKDPKESKEETLIYMFFNYDGRRLKYSTGEKVPPKYWNPKSQVVRSSFHGYGDINGRLDTLKSDVLSLYRKSVIKDGIPNTAVLRQALDKDLGRRPDDKLTFFNIYDEFISITKSKVHPRTTQKYITLKSHLQNFQNKTKYSINFDSINITFFDKFIQFYMADLGLLNNTIGKYVSTLKTFLTWATEREYNAKMDYRKFKVYHEDADIVYLTYDELMKLYAMDLSENIRLERNRDAFCICCFTGLRFSDIKQLKPEDIKKETIIINSYKTRDNLRIPLNQFAKALIDKYIDQPKFLQVVSIQRMNDYLKELCELAEINEPVTLTKFRGVERLETTKPKFHFISTHTARRTFVTLSLEQGMRPEVVMQITGHKSYKTFKKYINITDKVKDNEMKRVWDGKTDKNP